MRHALLFVALASTVLLAQTPAKPTFFQNVRLFDGAHFIATTNVLIDGDLIRAVGPNVHAPEGAEMIDGAGKTLLPALIDSHVHAYQPEVLQQALAFGVGTVLDMFSDPKFIASIKRDEAQGKDLTGADIRSAGTLVTSPGGHGTEYGLKIPTISDPSEAQAFVDARIAEGSDYIKLIYDDYLEYGAKTPHPTISSATMKAVIDAAHKRGKMAVVHIGSEEQAREAIKDGADGIVHLFVGETTTPDFGKFVADHHAFVIPTFTVLHSICNDPSNAALASDPRFQTLLAPSDLQSLNQKLSMTAKLSCAGAVGAIPQLQAAHVPILAGTDAPNPGTIFGASLHQELLNLVHAGLTPSEALASATSIPARVFHLEDRGQIAPGKRADLLLVNGDPSVNIEATRDIVAVWKTGLRDNRDAYIAGVAKEQADMKTQAALPAPAGSESGLVSDFEGDKVSAQYGNWATSTDALAGGKSKAAMKLVPEGANGSKGSLEITGEIIPAFAYPWAGAMFSPGAHMLQPANLSSKKEIHFWAKGDGRSYSVMLFAKSSGMRPVTQAFVAGPEWKEFSFPLASFAGVDPHGLLGVLFAASSPPGTFDFKIDDVRIQ